MIAQATLALIVLTSAGAHAQGSIFVSVPASGDLFNAGETIFVAGSVRDFNGAPIAGVNVSAQLMDARGFTVPGVGDSGRSGTGGTFALALDLPTSLPGGSYAVFVSSPNATINSAGVSVRIVARYTSEVTPYLWGALVVVVVLALLGLFALFRATRPVPRPPPPGPGPQ